MRISDTSIDSRQLQVFVALTQGGSLKAAAKDLLVTESAISHAIRNLESSLGCKLFNRSGKGLVLTDSGSVLLESALDILGRMREIRYRLSDQGSDVSSVIRFASATSFIRSMMHDVLMEFMTCFPNVEVEVIAADRNRCLELLSSGQTDVAVMVNMPDDVSQVRGVHLFDDELYLMMSSKHPLSRHEEIPLHALCREKLFLRQSQNFTCHMIMEEVARRSFDLRNTSQIDSFDAVSELVRLGLGVAFQAPWACRQGWKNSEFTWRKVKQLELKRAWHFAWPSTYTIDIRGYTLLRLCQQAAHRISRELRASNRFILSPLVQSDS